MPIDRLTYEEFLSKTDQSSPNPFAHLIQQEKTVYVYALTRDRCSGCEIQKPLYERLVESIREKYGDQVRFGSIHVSQQDQFSEKLQDLRKVFKFAAYPTYLVLLRTEVGIMEIYRGIEPPMEELARNINIAVELANR
jgi:thiol-disulfide isomerase/thioredoxin